MECDLGGMIARASKNDLAKQIEQLVREHIAASHKEARAALERAFAEANGEPAQRSQGTKRTRPSKQRRTPDEIAALGERLYAAICETPGETMMVLAQKVGVTPRDLSVPAGRLKQAGRVRSAGQRSHTRYFPMVGDAQAAKEANA